MSASDHPRHGRRPPPATCRSRKGAVLVLTAFLVVVMLAMLAFAVDLGYMMTVETELKRATDSAALAGAGSLVDGASAAELQAFEYYARNPVAGTLLASGDGWQDELPQRLADYDGEFEVELGHWNPETRTFAQSDILPSSIRVTAAKNNSSLFFARALGRSSFDTRTESIARYLPRDIMLVLDFSASMNYDSQLKRIGEYGESVRPRIEGDLLQIYQDLGSPTYGTMQFTPQYISSTNNDTIKQTLGLRTRVGWRWVDTPYPYPSGSWDDYINKVRSTSSSSSYQRSGYYKKYGYLTLMNYWLESQPGNNRTPDLWKASAQPVKAVKDSVSIFMQYVSAVDCEDRVGLVVYNSASQNATLEHGLIADFAQIEDTVQHRQAGHYDWYTNIGAGVYEARQEIIRNARVGSFKMIVLMTDGQANKPYNESYARTYVLEQAQEVADLHCPIVTISLGNDADTALMQQVADLTGGVHFNIPGGESVVDYEEDLLKVFRKIADDRPLVLVK